MQFESYVLAAGTANGLIDVKFASGIKNINLGCYPYKPLPLEPPGYLGGLVGMTLL